MLGFGISARSPPALACLQGRQGRVLSSSSPGQGKSEGSSHGEDTPDPASQEHPPASPLHLSWPHWLCSGSGWLGHGRPFASQWGWWGGGGVRAHHSLPAGKWGSRKEGVSSSTAGLLPCFPIITILSDVHTHTPVSINNLFSRSLEIQGFLFKRIFFSFCSFGNSKVCDLNSCKLPFALLERWVILLQLLLSEFFLSVTHW